MKKITGFQKSEIKKFLEKYEKYFNFQDSESFEQSVDEVCKDICNKLEINPDNIQEVEEYVRSLYDLSDGEGLSFILSPGPTFIYNQADQVQRFHY